MTGPRPGTPAEHVVKCPPGCQENHPHGTPPVEAAATTPGQAAWEARHLAVFGVAAPDWAWGQLAATERTGMDAAAQAVLDRAFPGLKRERDGLHADRKRLTTALADMTEERDAIKDERDQLHGELTAARNALGDANTRLAEMRAKYGPSRCTWWSDPSDDFFGMCVKEAYHDREGDDEHENTHGIRWTGRRWEAARAALGDGG